MKRATSFKFSASAGTAYFNPRPREEGDARGLPVFDFPLIFQSTPSWRGRLVCCFISVVASTISIHALVKRATIADIYCLLRKSNFNPRPREEGDLADPEQIKIGNIFQSTPSWRGRLYIAAWHDRKATDFNPRPREEGDPWITAYQVKHRNFNPRPREEGDEAGYVELYFPLISIHALVKRATLSVQDDGETNCISIHALVKRATNPPAAQGTSWQFQSTPSWRGRRKKAWSSLFR